MKRMILVDGNSLMYRAYYGTSATGNLQQSSKGLYTNAIYAFARMMNHLINSEYDNILVAFDAGKKTIRHELMADLKRDVHLCLMNLECKLLILSNS